MAFSDWHWEHNWPTGRFVHSHTNFEITVLLAVGLPLLAIGACATRLLLQRQSHPDTTPCTHGATCAHSHR